MNIEEPVLHGWVLSDGMLDIKWMTCSPAPDEVVLSIYIGISIPLPHRPPALFPISTFNRDFGNFY